MAERPIKCPRCGGRLEHDREVEKPVRYGDDVALVSLRADVCTRCGVRLFDREMMKRMERVRDSLKEASSEAPVVGQVYDYRSVG